MNVMANGMRNRLSKPRWSLNENLTGCWQRNVVLGYERNHKVLNFTTNNTVLQIIPSEHNFDFHFHHRTGETCPAKPTCSDGPGGVASYRVNNFSSEQLGIWWIGGGNTNIA
jgi:hypothetical protein